MQLEISAIGPSDRPWVVATLREEWGGQTIVTRGQIHETDQLQGLIAISGEERVGLLTYVLANASCEIVSLNSFIQGKGVGSQLIKAVLQLARAKNCNKLWLITTNDNVEALQFYQKRGFKLHAIYPNAIEESRKLKPGIPKSGRHGIPIADEIELEVRLN